MARISLRSTLVNGAPGTRIWAVWLATEPELIELALTGGEDYELLFTVAPARQALVTEVATRCGLPLTRVGEVTPPEGGLVVKDRDGRDCTPRRTGFNHFGAAAIA